jgi:hypothetical protein
MTGKPTAAKRSLRLAEPGIDVTSTPWWDVAKQVSR